MERIFILFSYFLLVFAEKTDKTQKCQEISIPMCKGIGYNHTAMPNSFNHDTQEEAGMEVHQYWPLVEIKCSPDLRFFLCSLYVPICMEDYVGPAVPACSSVCERAKVGCEPVMVHYGFQWPEKMQCDKFPKYGKNNLCMDEKKGEEPLENAIVTNLGPPTNTEVVNGVQKCKCDCRTPLVRVDNGNNSTIVGDVLNCALPCRMYSSDDEIWFSNWWLTLWAGVCFFTTFLTLLTFFVDGGRFKYPERPIVYLSACYMMVSIGYIIRLYKGHDEVACKGEIVRYSIETGAASAWCTVVFLLIYYFGMASSIWWVTLSLTWYLAAGCKWGSEAIASHAHLFHIAAWVLPALGTLTAIMDGAVDGDSVSGICLIGNQDALRLSIYIVAPLSCLLLLGTSFLFAGFIALVRIRQVIARQAGRQKTEKLEKLMIRIGVFSVLYTLPASAVIATYFYEMSAKSLWIESVTCQCKGGVGGNNKPLYSVLMIKYFMSLAVGITSGVWIWSGKTVESWQKFLQRLCRRKYSSAYHHPPGKSTHV